MQRTEKELAVGDSLQLGDCILTVIDIDGEDVSFRIDQGVAAGFAVASPHDMVFVPKK